jgi:hypothetical protein
MMYYPGMSEQAILQPEFKLTVPGETAQSLLQDPEARIRGKPVSATQLARWHREGYLPTPVRKGLGRGKGTVSIYPAGTREQLRALCAFFSKERDAEKVAWRLWWAGYAVPSAFAHPWLERAAGEWETYVQALLAEQTAEERELHLLPEGVADVVDQAATARLRRPLLRRMRVRAGPDGFSALFRMILEMASGTFHGYYRDPDGSSAEDQQIVTKALGLNRLTSRGLLPPDLNVAAAMEADLRVVGELIATTQPQQLLETLSEGEQARARDDLRVLASALHRLRTLMEGALGKRDAKIFADLDRAVREMKPLDQAVSLLLWHAMRLQSMGARMDFWVQMARMVETFLPLLQAYIAAQKKHTTRTRGEADE